MNWTIFLLYLSATLFVGLGVAALFREVRSAAQISFVGLMFILGLDAVFGALSADSSLSDQLLYFQRASFFARALVPVFWLVFSLSFARGNASQFLFRWRIPLAAAAGLPMVVLTIPGISTIRAVGKHAGQENWFLALGYGGIAVQALLLIGCAVALTNLEGTFRAATGTMRWRIKYLILGAGVLLGVTIYTSSQAILFRGIDLSILETEAVARLVGCSLIAFSLFRTRLAEIEIYPSHAFVYRSLTAVVAGAYLLLVGMLGKVASLFGGGGSLPFRALLALLALVGLAVVFMSDRIRLYAQRAVSRHLRRPTHDYRALWTLFAERTSSLVTREDLCREVAKFLSETFNVLSVTLFLVDEERQELFFGASTSLPENQANSILQARTSLDPLFDWKRHSDPVDLDSATEPWVARLKELNPAHFRNGGSRTCLPLVASGQLLGFVTLTDRVSGIPFAIEDFDLLKCIGGQTAASLLNIRLSARLVHSKELEAFQSMSTFFVHDLKNTALMLSLMLENLPVHFANPDFREDSLRSISKTVNRINDLISRLGLLRQGLKIHPVETDLNSLVSTSLANLPTLPRVELTENLVSLPKIRLDPDQIQKVLTNLVLNARDAIRESGQIRVGTFRNNGWAVLEVTDNGCGISPEFMTQSLFRPFQTTKKKGIGIGMYQSKMIVEAHFGRMEVESEPGKGATFRVLLPLNHTNA